jgi:HK97 family phage major capsid protein
VSTKTRTARLREQRAALRADRDQILDRSAHDDVELSADELAKFNDLVSQLDGLDDQLETARDQEVAELRAAVATRGRPQLSTEDRATQDAFLSAILEKNPHPIVVRGEPRAYWQPGVEQRDLLKSTATQALPVNVYDTIVMHLVENSSVMAAGATVVETATGEDLQVPKSTAYATSALTAEGAAITESDATLGISTLKAYKYASFFQVSQELATDTPTNLLDFLARQAGQSLALAFGPNLITGTGSGQPQGIVTAAGTGVTGPVGTTVSLGTQSTAGQGTDLLYSLIGSLAEPYSRQPSTGFIMTNGSLAIARKLKDSTGQPVAGMVGGGLNAAVSGAPSGNNVVLGYPCHVDPNVAAMAANAKSIIFGDLSRYFVRIAGGIRFERSDEFAFQNDLVSFKAIIRLDGGLVDANGVKLFVNSAT